MMVINVWVKAHGASTNIDESQLAHRGQIGQGLIDGAQRDARHLDTCVREQGLGGRMHRVAMHQTEK